MKFLKPVLPIVFFALLALAVVACAQAPNVTPPASGGYTPPATGGNNPPTTGSDSSIVHTMTASVKGTSETVLTNAQGLTLYYFTPDTSTTSKCIGACAQTWHALLVDGSYAASSSPALPGMLSMQMNVHGNQVEYNGHFLYTFKGDSAPGQTNGEGVGGKWFVATPNLQ